MQCRDYISHYKTDAELFDYFETKSAADADSARRIQQAVAREIDWNITGYILDIGSGNGWLAKERSKQNSFIISCDISVSNLKKLKSISGQNHFAVAGDAHRIPFRSESISGIVASEVLEHLNSPQSALTEFYRVAKNNAKVIVSTPYKEIIRTSLCIHCNRETPLNAHLHSFDKTKLSELLTSSGWKSFRFSIIQNKAFVTLRISSLLHFLPYWLWRIFDRSFMLFFKKANTIFITATKSIFS